MTTLPPFQLDVAPPISEVSTPAGITVLRLCDDPATSRRLGSFNHDRETGLYPHEWSSLAEFDTWREEEEITYSIKFVASSIAHGNKLWTSRHHYICSRGWSGGKHKYEKKCPDRVRKKGSIKTGCRCKIIIKQYPHTPIVLGRYEQDHNHELGLANVSHMHFSYASQEHIRIMLQRHIDPRKIVQSIQRSAQEGSRDRMITLNDVSRLSRVFKLEEVYVRLHAPISTGSWVDKSCSTTSPNTTQIPDKPQLTSTSTSQSQPEERLQSLPQDIARFSQYLVSWAITQPPPVQAEVIEAFRSAKNILLQETALAETSALPERDSRVAPSWPETTTKDVGVKRAPKRKLLPEERGMTERCIGVRVAKGKKRGLHQDSDAQSERLGKRAKHDELSTAANAQQARACAAPSESGLVPTVPPSQVPPSAVTSSLARGP